MENKYFINDNKNLTKKQLARAKANNFYLFNAMAKLRSSVRKGQKRIGGPLRSAMLGGKLQFDDEYTGLDSNDLGGKIKFLITSIGDDKHPENLKMFKESFFYTVFLKKIVTGQDFDNDLKNWPLYKNISTNEEVKTKSAFGFACMLVKDDMSLPLGFDFSKVIDTIVQTDENGNYYLEDNCSSEDELAITEALNYQISILQNHPEFEKNFVYTEKENELYDFEDENEI